MKSIQTLRVPHTLVLLFGMMVLAYAAAWLLPSGAYETVVNEQGASQVVFGSYQVLSDQTKPAPSVLFTSIPRAMADAQGIIFFVLLIGGALAVLRASGAIDAAFGLLLQHFGSRPALLVLIGMSAFLLGSTTIGMAEEYVALIPILLTLCVAMRMDTISAVAIIIVGSGIGYGMAVMNPFTVLIAQDIAELQPTSGWELRTALTLPFLAIGFHHVWRYTQAVQRDPTASLVHDIAEAQPPALVAHPTLERKHVLVLLVTVATLVLVVWGIAQHGWYFVEMGAVFCALALLVALISGQGLDDTAKNFMRGASDLAGTAMLIGFARAISVILEDGQVLHTLVHVLSAPLTQVGPHLSAVGMLLFQSVLNFFVPSGSGQAYVTMPLMAPMADLVGVSRQVAVLAFQMGDGFMNMIVPTNAILMGILGICGIPYDRWFRFIAPLILKLLVAGSITLMLAVSFGYT